MLMTVDVQENGEIIPQEVQNEEPELLVMSYTERIQKMGL